jgi:hypothetical protein
MDFYLDKKFFFIPEQKIPCIFASDYKRNLIFPKKRQSQLKLILEITRNNLFKS